ncbi:ABC transporter ATP-binding protein [Bacteroidales bacterium OttesenSCG-928-B11]|nr:ABC transporter ATP-binding protein [Bacteroidales bacterium OttesenSCG-928-C03]MDL2312470.1 ABC transporter ATP-binding protein [Bacteroidales bacterium OttesenSCG-928-B11]MDL2326535.1 ABC transporter ATP-binding protein [Bacteroidales bacterium OttesenSCG-928-A14]
MIQISNLSYSYDKKEVLTDISIGIRKGDFCALMGLNGSGKSTLLKVIAGLLPIRQGEIRIEGKNSANYSPTLLAQQIAYVPQQQDIVFDFSVWDTVMMGRNPYQGRWETESARDKEIVNKVLKQCHIEHLKERMLSQLSGGEMQRTLIARAMAQEAPIMLLDEPLSNLDIIHKYEIMGILTKLNRNGQTIIIILHDFPVAIQYVAKTIILKNGQLENYGNVIEVLSPENIRLAFDLPDNIQIDKSGNVSLATHHK